MDELSAPFWNSIEPYKEYKMARITHEQLYREIKEIRIVLLGVPETEDMGLYGEVRDLIKLVRTLNGTVKSDHAWVAALKWVVGLLALALIGTITTGIIGIW